MIFALVRKEIKEHGFALAIVYALCLMWIGVTALGEQRIDPSADAFSLARAGLRVAIVVFAFALTGRLVRKEYELKTQLFLEGLPLSRVTMLVVKALLGSPWDDELEVFRYAGEGAPVRWVHEVG